MESEQTPKKTMSPWKARVIMATVSLTGLVAAVSAEAVDINGTVGPILDSVIAIIPTLINLIVAIVPAVIVLAVVGFIVAFFDRILSMMKL